MKQWIIIPYSLPACLSWFYRPLRVPGLWLFHPHYAMASRQAITRHTFLKIWSVTQAGPVIPGDLTVQCCHTHNLSAAPFCRCIPLPSACRGSWWLWSPTNGFQPLQQSCRMNPSPSVSVFKHVQLWAVWSNSSLGSIRHQSFWWHSVRYSRDPASQRSVNIPFQQSEPQAAPHGIKFPGFVFKTVSVAIVWISPMLKAKP